MNQDEHAQMLDFIDNGVKTLVNKLPNDVIDVIFSSMLDDIMGHTEDPTEGEDREVLVRLATNMGIKTKLISDYFFKQITNRLEDVK